MEKNKCGKNLGPYVGLSIMWLFCMNNSSDGSRQQTLATTVVHARCEHIKIKSITLWMNTYTSSVKCTFVIVLYWNLGGETRHSEGKWVCVSVVIVVSTKNVQNIVDGLFALRIEFHFMVEINKHNFSARIVLREYILSLNIVFIGWIIRIRESRLQSVTYIAAIV